MTDPAGVGQLPQVWRAKHAEITSFHATMGTGWKVCADELAASLAVLAAAIAPLQSLLDKLDAVLHADPRYKMVWTMFAAHGYHYTEPTYTAELAAAKEAISAIQQQLGGPEP